ncbi:MAG: hypothetical protein A3F11_11160 [Gammaproteobacteria bacterium RIFCSPHIGHO2_12_FULL_37_14]|nr:MAG: hypothetical protein A3F11_11160 [Gammaproteobacteria bacterium RIFCSPHIGHO2_12_FULL_37_14]
MSIQRICALSLRYFYSYTADFWKFINSIYWCSIEILIWVNVGKWLQNGSGLSAESLANVDVTFMTKFFIISAIVWMPFVRAAYDVSLAVLREIQSSNVSNIFSSPIEFKEWVTSLIIFSSVVNFIIITFSFLFVYVFYSLNMFSFYLLPLMLIIFFAGISLGFVTSGLIIYFGLKVEDLVYMLPWSMLPFSGVYYSLSTLPYWMEMLGVCLPMSYIFTYVHSVVENKPANMNLIWVALTMTLVYFILSFLFFKFMFNKSKDLGLSRFK